MTREYLGNGCFKDSYDDGTTLAWKHLPRWDPPLQDILDALNNDGSIKPQKSVLWDNAAYGIMILSATPEDKEET